MTFSDTSPSFFLSEKMHNVKSKSKICVYNNNNYIYSCYKLSDTFFDISLKQKLKVQSNILLYPKSMVCSHNYIVGQNHRSPT